MATATTSAQLIREDRRNLVESLRPEQLRESAFREFDRSEDFREWAESIPASCLRRFQIRDLNTYEVPLVSDMLIEDQVTQFELVIAYPADDRFGKDQVNGLEDAIRSDHKKITNRIGVMGHGDYPAGCAMFALSGYEIEREQDVWFLVETFDVNFREAVILSGPKSMEASASVSVAAGVAEFIRGTIMGASGSVSVTAPSADFLLAAGGNVFASAFATEEWTLQALSGPYPNNVGTDEFDLTGGSQGVTADGLTLGGSPRVAWEGTTAGSKCSCSDTTTGDSNNEDFAARVVFRMTTVPGANKTWMSKYAGGGTGWLVWYSSGMIRFLLKSGANFVYLSQTITDTTVADSAWHYLDIMYDKSANTTYMKSDLFAEVSASTASVTGSITNSNQLQINGYGAGGTNGHTGCKYTYAGISVGANAQSFYDEVITVP